MKKQLLLTTVILVSITPAHGAQHDSPVLWRPASVITAMGGCAAAVGFHLIKNRIKAFDASIDKKRNLIKDTCLKMALSNSIREIAFKKIEAFNNNKAKALEKLREKKAMYHWVSYELKNENPEQNNNNNIPITYPEKEACQNNINQIKEQIKENKIDNKEEQIYFLYKEIESIKNKMTKLTIQTPELATLLTSFEATDIYHPDASRIDNVEILEQYKDSENSIFSSWRDIQKIHTPTKQDQIWHFLKVAEALNLRANKYLTLLRTTLGNDVDAIAKHIERNIRNFSRMHDSLHIKLALFSVYKNRTSWFEKVWYANYTPPVNTIAIGHFNNNLPQIQQVDAEGMSDGGQKTS